MAQRRRLVRIAISAAQFLLFLSCSVVGKRSISPVPVISRRSRHVFIRLSHCCSISCGCCLDSWICGRKHGRRPIDELVESESEDERRARCLHRWIVVVFAASELFWRMVNLGCILVVRVAECDVVAVGCVVELFAVRRVLFPRSFHWSVHGRTVVDEASPVVPRIR